MPNGWSKSDFDLTGRIGGINMANPILVTGAAGRVGGVGRTIIELLLKQGKAVRAMVRNEDDRAQALRAMGVEVVVGNLLDLDSMHRAIAGCETMYFGMSVSDAYLAATVNAAAVAKHRGVKAFINMSQMTVSQMSITETTPSPQHKLHWLAEQALNWSALPVVHVRPTVFLECFFLTFTPDSVRESDQIMLPFREGRSSTGRMRRHLPRRQKQKRVECRSGDAKASIGCCCRNGARICDPKRR